MRRIPNRAQAGLYPILDSRLVPVGDMADVALVLRHHGVQQLQIRMKRSSDALRLRAQDAVAGALENSGMLIVINDRPDLALMLQREAPSGVRVGLHLGQGDVHPARARDRVGDGIHISWSTHDLAQVESSGELPLDGIAYGPVFATSSKENPDPAVGLTGLRDAVAVSPWPVTAIGGVGPSTLGECVEAGAASVAVIGALFSTEHVGDLATRVARLQGGFV